MAEEASALGLVRFWAFTPATDMLKRLQSASEFQRGQPQAKEGTAPPNGRNCKVCIVLSRYYRQG